MSNVARRLKIVIAGVIGASLAAAPLTAISASATTDGTSVVISEVYLNGGSSGATYTNKFVELYNPTASSVSLSGMSLQYRAAATTTAPTTTVPLTGTIASHAFYLVSGGSNGSNGAALPTPDQTSTLNSAAASGTIILATQPTVLTTLPTGSLTGAAEAAAHVADLYGYGTSNTFEGTPGGNASVTTSRARVAAGTDTDSNAADFTAGPPTPTSSTGTPPVDPPTDPTAATIAEIQGTTDTSPLAGQTVTTDGVVTAAYPTGGFNGYYLQTAGTGGALDLATHTASDAVFVYSPSTVGSVAVGDHVRVTGAVSEYQGLTELSVTTPVEKLAAATAPTPATFALTSDTAQRESVEGMLVAPQGDFTITDDYDTNYYGSIVLNPGTKPLDTPTQVVEPGAAAIAKAADNAARVVTLDDGSSTNFSTTTSKELPYLSLTHPVRIGEAVTFTQPVIFDYRFSAWSFQPTQELTTANAATVQPVTFSNTRTSAPATLGGDVTIASFNVLNYFTTTGDELTGCTYYTDRAGDPVTVNSGCDARGAAEQEDLDRQQAKIVAAINDLGASVVSLEEIENSARFGEDRDASLAELVTALNAAAGAGTWAFVPSPAAVPASEDVIRTAFIYKPAAVEPVGSATILNDPAFANARQPLAQEFELAGEGADTAFLAIVNHFKSKGSGTGADADQGDGQGASNASRVAQAHALVDFADGLKTSTGASRVVLMGDFNAYLKEDPIDVLTAAGYVDLGSTTGKSTYAFDGAVGSLDHIFINDDAQSDVAGADVWNINAYESIALEYSRYNYNALNLYAPDPYRASDHDPILVGLDLQPKPVNLNLLNINDFHGRIDANTVKFAGTIEQLRAAGGEDNTLLLSAGDNIGASLFASATQQDQPTIDVLNELDLTASAVGNHEFDQGYSDLTGRVTDAADWDYLGANVYLKGTTTPALPEYKVVTVDGLRVAIVGAVTEETPSLVSPGGITDLDFGDPVEAVNRVVGELKADDAADVFIAEYHEGAGAGTPDGATLEQEVAAGGAFAEIVNDTTPDVAAIFTGHTHKQYAWDAPVPGEAGATRPILQTGEYGGNIGQITLTIDPATEDVTAYTARNVARTTVADADLVAAYPRVAEVKQTVDAALAHAAEVGNQPVASITQDITTAFSGGSRDDRASESTLGDLVADALVDKLKAPETGGAEIGVVNPGGLRADLLYAKSGAETEDGVVTYAEANAVLPFVNNLWTTSLTGAQFKTVLEQQWQTNADGTVPSRPYLQLGLSKNVTYTYDASRAAGDRITSISVNGAPIDPAASYRIGTFSFLALGGDNFREFANGTDTRDSGLIDRDAWIDYLGDHSPVTPDFARQAVAVTGIPTAPVTGGSTVTLSLSKLDLTSLGSPANTELSATFEGSTAAAQTAPVTAGAASLSVTVPTDVSGAATLVIVAKPSGTTVRIPIEIEKSEPLKQLRTTPVVIVGLPIAGLPLVAVRGSWGPAPVHVTYQWSRDGVDIAGATGAVYRTTRSDRGHTITVTVTGTKDGYETATRTDSIRLLKF